MFPFLLIISRKGFINFPCHQVFSPEHPWKAGGLYLPPREWSLRHRCALACSNHGQLGIPGARKIKHFFHLWRSSQSFLLWEAFLHLPRESWSLPPLPYRIYSTGSCHSLVLSHFHNWIVGSISLSSWGSHIVAFFGNAFVSISSPSPSKNVSMLLHVSSCKGAWHSQNTGGLSLLGTKPPVYVL